MFHGLGPLGRSHTHGSSKFSWRAWHFHLGRKFLCPESDRAAWRASHRRPLAHRPAALQHRRRGGEVVDGPERIQPLLKTWASIATPTLAVVSLRQQGGTNAETQTWK